MPEFEVDRDVMIPMRDGVRLATDIYRPVRMFLTKGWTCAVFRLGVVGRCVC